MSFSSPSSPSPSLSQDKFKLDFWLLGWGWGECLEWCPYVLGKEGGEGKLVMGKCCSPPVTGYSFFSRLTLICHRSSQFSGFPSAVLLRGPWVISLMWDILVGSQPSQARLHSPELPTSRNAGSSTAMSSLLPFSSCSEWHIDISPYLLSEEVLCSCKCSLTQKGFSWCRSHSGSGRRDHIPSPNPSMRRGCSLYITLPQRWITQESLSAPPLLPLIFLHKRRGWEWTVADEPVQQSWAESTNIRLC